MLMESDKLRRLFDQAASLMEIKRKVLCAHPVLAYEWEFIRLLSSKQPSKSVLEARNFFLEDYSLSILNSIARNICHCKTLEIFGEYYEFISRPDFATLTPYYKLTLYENKNGADLKTYVSSITTRYFRRVQQKKVKEEKRLVSMDESDRLVITFSGNEVIENPWFELLLSGGESSGHALEDEELRQALGQLPYREQLIIKLTVMDDASGLEAFEELKGYLNPKIPLEEWNDKQKQNAMALLRGRALQHLKKILDV